MKAGSGYQAGPSRDLVDGGVTQLSVAEILGLVIIEFVVTQEMILVSVTDRRAQSARPGSRKFPSSVGQNRELRHCETTN